MPSSFEPPSVESLNELLPAYDFVSLIASGDDEAVYVASQKSLDRHVAVKLYAPHLSGLDEFTRGFQKIARQMASLNHANLIGVFNSGTVEGMHYLVMEFVAGRSLWESFNGTAVELPRVAELMGGICDGLSHAHDNGILHGGLSVSNILVNQKGEPKVGNFGYLVSVPQAMDSPWKRFVAPEVAAGGELTTRADIYSLGAILYELVTGQPHGPGAMPPQVTIPGSEKLHVVWKKATAEHPVTRYTSVQDFHAACVAALPVKRAAVGGAVKRPAAAGRNLAPGARTPTPAATAHVVHKVGFNWKLLRNVIIIIILLYAIHLAWNRYSNEKDARARAVAEEEARKAREVAEKRAAEAAKMAERKRQWEEQQKKLSEKQQPVPEPVPVVIPEPPKEDKYAVLDRLRQKLHSGERSEMPPGAKSIGGDHFLFIDKPMTWPEASWFAEQHGAHLVVPTADATIAVLRTSVMNGASTEIWLGAAANGRDSWVLANGTVWKPSVRPAGDGHYVSIGSNDALLAAGHAAKRPFIIQWRKDGTNPGGLTALLQLTSASLSNGTPVYPPGTQAYGVRHYLYVSRPIDWKQAQQLAASSGGHLMVATGVAETFNLQRMTEEITAPDGIWIGGVGNGGRWTWVTGEPWSGGKWTGGNEPVAEGKAAKVLPGDGWVPADADGMASGFIIEWSSDATD